MIADVGAAIDGILGGIATLRNASGAGRIFELFVMTGIATRLQSQGFDIWLQRSDGSRIAPTDFDLRFIQRGGAPTGVPPAAMGPDNASVIGLRRLTSGSEWEIWNGIQFEGRSGATHEIDIAVVPRDIAVQLRLSGGLPFGRPIVAIECKDVGQPGTVDEMRAFVARLYDLTILQSHQPHIPFPPPTQRIYGVYPGSNAGNSFYSAKVTYWDTNRCSFSAIARRTGFSLGAAAMTNYYAVEPHGYITVGSIEASSLINAVAQWIVMKCP